MYLTVAVWCSHHFQFSRQCLTQKIDAITHTLLSKGIRIAFCHPARGVWLLISPVFERWLSIRDSVKGDHLVVRVVRPDAGGITGFCCWVQCAVQVGKERHVKAEKSSGSS
jgi:hypothetical protein